MIAPMSTITISKTQYEVLRRRAVAYERVVAAAREDIFSSPPTRDAKKVIRKFRATRRYSEAFLKSLEKGLSRSSYFKNR